MKHLDPKLLAEFRRAIYCEWCKKPRWKVWPYQLECAHIFSKGMGNACQLDIRINLCSLCRTCHQAHHDGQRPLPCDLLAVVAAREGMLQNEIEDTIRRLRNAPKGTRYQGSRREQNYPSLPAADQGIPF